MGPFFTEFNIRKVFSSLLLILILLISSADLFGQVTLLEDDFNFPAGTALNSIANSTVRSGAGTNVIQVTSPGLTYSNYAGSGYGNCISLIDNGEDISRDFAPVINSGSVYYAALVNVSAVGATVTTGDYFLTFHYNNTFNGRVFVKTDGTGGFFFGSGLNTGVYESTSRAFGQTYLVVVKYTFVSGTNNDRIDFWVNPAIGGTEPAATLSNLFDVTRTDYTGIVGVAIRQGTSGTAATVKIDGIRIGQDWATTVAPRYSWTGATSNDWTVETNWSPNRTTPANTDVLFFDGGGSPAVTNIPVQSVGGLVITNNTTFAPSSSNLTVAGRLTLGAGSLSNGTNNINLGNGATICMDGGTIAAAPVFGTSTGLIYYSSSNTTPGVEFPSTGLNNLYISNAAGFTLNSSINILNRFALAANLNLNSNTITLGSSASSVGAFHGGVFTGTGFLTGTGSFKRWYAGSAPASTGSQTVGLFPFGAGANNRNLSITGTPTAGGTITVQYNDAAGASAINFVENSLTFVNRSNSNWVVTAADGITGAAFALKITGGGLPGVNAIADLNVSGAAGAAGGTFSATTGTTALPVVNRTALSEATVSSTFYIAATSNSPLIQLPGPTNIAQLTNGIALSPLKGGTLNKALIGFSLTSVNLSPVFTAINVQSSVTTVGKLANFKLYKSVDNDFLTDGDNTLIAGVTANQTATEVQLSGFADTLALTARNYFLAADIDASVTAATDSVRLSFTQANVTVSGLGVNAGTVTGNYYTFIPQATTYTSTAAGNWSTMVWNPVGVPGLVDNIVIADGHTVTINQAVAVNSIKVGQGTAAAGLAYDLTAGRVVTISGDLTIDTLASFSASAGTGDTLVLGGNLLNNGTFNVGVSGFVTKFIKAGDQTVSTTRTPVTTAFRSVILSKGASANKVICSVPINMYMGSTGSSGSFTSGGTGMGTWEQTAGAISANGTHYINANTEMLFSGSGGYSNTGAPFKVAAGKLTVNTTGTFKVGASSSYAFQNDSTSTGIITLTAGNLDLSKMILQGGTTIINGATVKLNLSNVVSGANNTFEISKYASFTFSSGSVLIGNPVKTGTGTGGKDITIAQTTGTLSVTGGSFILGDGGNTNPGIVGFQVGSVVPLNNLEVNTGGALLRTASLNTNLDLQGNLTLTSGLLVLGAYNLNLSPASTITGTPSATAMIVSSSTGELRKSFTAAGAFTYPVGDSTGTDEYSPVTVNFNSGSFASAYLGVKLVNAKHPNNLSAANYLNRYWTLTQSGITNFRCDVTLQYADTDVMGTETSIWCGKYDNPAWTLFGATNDTTNTLRADSINSFSDFTGGERAFVPVELTSFTSSLKGNDVVLQWETATELNSKLFEIQIQAKNESWSKIGEVKAAGTTTDPKQYTFTSKNYKPGTYSFRLRLVDLDGSYTYSSTINTEITVPKEFALSQNYPNPFNPSTTITYALPKSSQVSIKIYDIIGNMITELVNENKEAGVYSVSFEAKNLPSGIYLYQIKAGEFTSTKKMSLLK